MGAGKSSIGRRLAARLQLPFVDADTEIEAARRHDHPGNFRSPWRAVFPRRRGAGDRAAARRRAGGARDRRRRLHARGDPQAHRATRHLDLAQGRCRHHHEPRQAPRRPSAAADRRPGCDRRASDRASASRSIATPISRSRRATCRTRQIVDEMHRRLARAGLSAAAAGRKHRTNGRSPR